MSDQQREYLGLARLSCDHMRRCVDDLVDASRLETGRLSIVKKPCFLKLPLKHATRSLEAAFVEKGVALSVEIDEALEPITCDDSRIAQVITNLLRNSLRFTRPGGRVTVTLEASRTQAGCQVISVVDTGCGIPPEAVESVFDRLYQVQPGDGSLERGLGLGLFLCRELARLHGGDVTLESRLDVGSHFRLVLPELPLTQTGWPCPSRASNQAVPLARIHRHEDHLDR